MQIIIAIKYLSILSTISLIIYTCKPNKKKYFWIRSWACSTHKIQRMTASGSHKTTLFQWEALSKIRWRKLISNFWTNKTVSSKKNSLIWSNKSLQLIPTNSLRFRVSVEIEKWLLIPKRKRFYLKPKD